MKFRTNYRRPQRHHKLKCEEEVMDAVFGYMGSILRLLKLRDNKKEAQPQALYDILCAFHGHAAKQAALAFLQDNYPQEIEYAIHSPDLYQEVRKCTREEGLPRVHVPDGHKRSKVSGPSTQVPQRWPQDNGQRSCRIHLDKNVIEDILRVEYNDES